MTAREYLWTQEALVRLSLQSLRQARAAKTAAEKQAHRAEYEELCRGAWYARRAFRAEQED